MRRRSGAGWKEWALERVAGRQDQRTTAGEREAIDRRHRDIAPGRRQILDAVGQKVLHGFLQNRHQTLMPLSVNLASLAGAERVAVARFAAVAVLAGGAAEAPRPVRAWLIASGADEETLATFEDALRTPPPLTLALAGLTTPEMDLIAFILCLVAAREGGAAASAFADYVAAARALPSTLVRAAERRYRV